MTGKFLALYLWGLIISSNLIVTFYSSTLKIKVLEVVLWLFKKEHNVITLQDFDDYMFKNCGAFGEMLGCPLCFGFWLSLGVAIPMQQYFQLPAYYIIFSIFSWPSLCYKALDWFKS